MATFPDGAREERGGGIHGCAGAGGGLVYFVRRAGADGRRSSVVGRWRNLACAGGSGESVCSRARVPGIFCSSLGFRAYQHVR